MLKISSQLALTVATIIAAVIAAVTIIIVALLATARVRGLVTKYLIHPIHQSVEYHL